MGAAKPDNQGKSYDADWEILDPREQDYRDALGDGLEIMLRIRDKIAGTWCGRIPPPEKYLNLPYYDCAVAEL